MKKNKKILFLTILLGVFFVVLSGVFDSKMALGYGYGYSAVYRFWSPLGRSHFFTISESEKNNVIANYSNDWDYEGIAYHAYPSSGSGLVPIYRFYSPTGKSHFFTRSESEKNNVIANYSNDWNYEGIAYYAYPSSDSDLTPVYRFYSPTGKSHFFTKSEVEKNSVITNYSNDWNYEGIAWYVPVIYEIL